MFTLTIKTGNAAFRDDSAADEDYADHTDAAMRECARILREAAKHLENGADHRNLIDANGNKVGVYTLVMDD